MDSEIALDNAIKSLSVLGETPLLPLLVKSGSVETLTSLVAHENSDISDSAIKVIGELIDIDNSADQDDIQALTQDLLTTYNFGTVLTQFLELKLNTNEMDSESVADALRIVENINSLGLETTVLAFYNTKLVRWLLQTLNSPSCPSTIKYNSAELLASMLVTSPRFSSLVTSDGVDALLQAIAPVRKGSVRKGSDEEGFYRDLFDSLIRSLRSDSARHAFLENEGIELMLILVKDGSSASWVRQDAFRVLGEALKGSDGDSIAKRIVEAGGLKRLFSILSKRATKGHKREAVDEVLHIVAYLLRWLPLGSSERNRVVAKFAQDKFEKLGIMLDLRRKAIESLNAQKEVLRNQKSQHNDDENEDDAELRRYAEQLEEEESLLKAGKERLRSIDIILSWLAIEYAEFKDELVKNQGVDAKQLAATLEDNITMLREFTSAAEADDQDEAFEQQEAQLTLDMLETLVENLLS